jgi:TPP-dependent trihydroxycyclohexane-1,2-dione (THcHDO) dehydratase
LLLIVSLYYRITSPSPYSKLDSFDQKQELEKEFCRDFSCCGLSLSNLHQLLEHYEEYHLSRRASNGGSGSDDDEPDQNSSMRNITCSNNSHQTFVEDDLLLQQPMHLAQLTTASSISTTTKEHFTNSDLNMLENVQKYAATASVQTLDSINDGLNTPRLSPCNSGFHNENYFDEDASENSNWRAHRENYTSTSDSTNSEGKALNVVIS